ncbi:MAG: hypothetical protein KAH01_03305 [Caldisericia bacterium]|nr:hypothetical protein [Caldisericia bacterium]
MGVKICKTDEEIANALMQIGDTPSSEELDRVVEFCKDLFDNPAVVTLANYMDAVYALVEQECGEWSEYIDFQRYLKDLVQNEENMFNIAKTDGGYCIAYENIPEDDDDDSMEMEPLEL